MPEVSYQLWPKTLDLLTKYGRQKDNPVLVNEDGGPLQKKSIGSDGRPKVICNISSMYKRLKPKLKLDHPLKSLRKTSSDLLYNHKEYRPLHALFLGHSPRTVAERFYVNVNKSTLDNAIEWLGQQYGILPSEGGDKEPAAK